MDAQEFRNLQEAYLDVVENQQLDEELTGERLKRAEDKMKSLGRKKSTLPSREALSRVSIGKEGTGTEGGMKAPTKRGGGGTKGRSKVSGSGGDDMDRGSGNKAARRSGTYRKAMWESDIYDIILSHLLDEGYADTQEAAEAIMVNMSEEWREDIVETETGRGPRLIDAYDKPPYSDDVKDAPKYKPFRKGLKIKGVVKK